MATSDVWTVEEVTDKVEWEGGWDSFFRWGGQRIETDDPEFTKWLRTAAVAHQSFMEAVDELDRIRDEREAEE